MAKSSNRFRQKDFYPILKRRQNDGCMLTQTECVRILRTHGATQTQARNTCYNFLHHRKNLEAHKRGSQKEYDKILDDFYAPKKTCMECILHLETLEFSVGQAKSAVHKYRVQHGLVGH
jgi:hypothetical protein